MSSPQKTEMFTAQQLKEAREEFNSLKKLMMNCQELSKDNGGGKCDFNSILACLYSIEKNQMYKFLAERDPTFKQIIDVTFLRLRNVGGIMEMANHHEELSSKEEEEFKKDLEGLDNLIMEKNISSEQDLKRKLEEILEEDEEP